MAGDGKICSYHGELLIALLVPVLAAITCIHNMPIYIDTPEHLRPELKVIRDSFNKTIEAFRPPFSRAITANTPGTDGRIIRTSLEELQSLWNGRQMNYYWISMWSMVKMIITKKISEEKAERALDEITASHKLARSHPRHKLAFGLNSQIIIRVSEILLRFWKNPENLTHVEFFYLLTWISKSLDKDGLAWSAIDEDEWFSMVSRSCLDIKAYIARQPFGLPKAITPMDRLALHYILPETKAILKEVIPKLVHFMDQDNLKREDLAREIFDLRFLPAPICAEDVPEAARRRARMTDPHLKDVVGSAIVRGWIQKEIASNPDPVSILKLAQVRVQYLCNTLQDDVLLSSE
ncbi:hypothetical protein BDP81DRAFT_475691 [Colletotrichum phormii]|uniref:Uncharacterized protein n=1 Tax=Colletotrichum phormii TaxID=359342 RepID=A0AAI9ZF56_9PEZI|nr:uncharacterized protein BDP81DRAFT_475691 [Colletotrichum phormii]KAK1623423.1 hypothetical protein BDP81DRAFT_475691 [Colletotrichum phormii]